MLKEGEVYQLDGPGGTSDACAPIWPLIEGRSRRAVQVAKWAAMVIDLARNLLGNTYAILTLNDLARL